MMSGEGEGIIKMCAVHCAAGPETHQISIHGVTSDQPGQQKMMRISPGEKGTGDLWIAINAFMLLLIQINCRRTCNPPSHTNIKVHQIMIFLLLRANVLFIGEENRGTCLWA